MKLNEIYAFVGQSRYGIITAYRPENSTEVNKTKLEELKGIILGRGYRAMLVIGKWKGKEEPSLLVPRIHFGEIIELGHRYHQDAIMFRGMETDGLPMMVFMDGRRERLKSAFAGSPGVS